MSRPVTVQYLKYPDVAHWRHDLVWLGEDAHGTWLGAPVGTVIQRGSEPAQVMQWPFVQLVTPDSWWTALFNGGHPRITTYVDITTVAGWVGPNLVEFVDLDLDVVLLRDGTIYVDDEDEFDEHRLSLGYPAHMVDSARAAAARVVLEIERRHPPFDDASDRWMTEVV